MITLPIWLAVLILCSGIGVGLFAGIWLCEPVTP